MTQQQKKMDFRDLRKKFRVSAPFNHPNNFGKEGIDHINISIQSETRLGKIFDPAYLKVINYKHIGKFNSVMSLWYWIRSSDLNDTIRRLTGRNLKTYAEANGVFSKFVPNFKAIIAQATWNKIKGYPSILKEIRELNPEIKLISYHIVKSSGLRISTSYAALIIDITELIIKAVKEGKEPDFNSFVDTKEKAGMAFLEGVLERVMSEETLERMRAANAITDEEDHDYELPEPQVEDQSKDEKDYDCELTEPQVEDQALEETDYIIPNIKQPLEKEVVA